MSDEEFKARREELERIAKPVVDFLYEYGCPHASVIITETSAELVFGECAVPFEPRD